MKIKKIILLIIFIQIATVLFLFSIPSALAVNDSLPKIVMPDLQIDINGLKGKFFQPTSCGTDSAGNVKMCNIWISQYITAIYKYALGIVGILATVVMMIGGIIWLTAGGSSSRITEAKAWITASLTGLIIALTSYTILYQVNPALLGSKALEVSTVKKALVVESLSGCAWKAVNNCSEAGTGWQNGGVDDCAETDTEENVTCCCSVASDALQYAAAKNKLDPWIQVPNPKTLQGIKEQTINELNSFVRECNGGLNFGCGSIIITSGTTGDHASGEFSHTNGWKVDINLSPDITKYITDSEKNKGAYVYKGARKDDGAKMYQNSRGACYALESDHWDIKAAGVGCP